VGGSGIGGASEGGAQANHFAGQVDMEDPEEEVTETTPVASTMTADRMEQVMSLQSRATTVQSVSPDVGRKAGHARGTSTPNITGPGRLGSQAQLHKA
jgi:hypothetical protein